MEHTRALRKYGNKYCKSCQYPDTDICTKANQHSWEVKKKRSSCTQTYGQSYCQHTSGGLVGTTACKQNFSQWLSTLLLVPWVTRRSWQTRKNAVWQELTLTPVINPYRKCIFTNYRYFSLKSLYAFPAFTSFHMFFILRTCISWIMILHNFQVKPNIS